MRFTSLSVFGVWLRHHQTWTGSYTMLNKVTEPGAAGMTLKCTFDAVIVFTVHHTTTTTTRICLSLLLSHPLFSMAELWSVV